MTVSGMKGTKYSLHDWILSTMIWKRILKGSQCILSFLSQPLISTGLRTPVWVGRGLFHYYIKWNTGGILAFHHINFRLVNFESLMLRRGLMLPENTVMLLWFLSVCLFWSCGILVPWPGINPCPPAVEVQGGNHWTAREVPSHVLLNWKSRLAPFYFVLFMFQVIF